MCGVEPTQDEDMKKREENLAEARSVTIEQDPSLPAATKVGILLGRPP